MFSLHRDMIRSCRGRDGVARDRQGQGTRTAAGRGVTGGRGGEEAADSSCREGPGLALGADMGEGEGVVVG